MRSGDQNNGRNSGTTTGSVPLNGTVSLNNNVDVYCTAGTQQPPRWVAAGVMMPHLAAHRNFSVPCSTIPAGAHGAELPRAPPPASILSSPRMGDSAGAGTGYGPLSQPATYQGGALGRFSPPISFWRSTVPNGLKDIARAALKNWRCHLPAIKAVWHLN